MLSEDGIRPFLRVFRLICLDILLPIAVGALVVIPFSDGGSGWTLLESVLSRGQSWPGSSTSWVQSGLLVCLQTLCRAAGGLCAMIAKCDSAALLLWNLSEVQLAKWGHLLGIDAIPILWQEAVVGFSLCFCYIVVRHHSVLWHGALSAFNNFVAENTWWPASLQRQSVRRRFFRKCHSAICASFGVIVLLMIVANSFTSPSMVGDKWYAAPCTRPTLPKSAVSQVKHAAVGSFAREHGSSGPQQLQSSTLRGDLPAMAFSSADYLKLLAAWHNGQSLQKWQPITLSMDSYENIHTSFVTHATINTRALASSSSISQRVARDYSLWLSGNSAWSYQQQQQAGKTPAEQMTVSSLPSSTAMGTKALVPKTQMSLSPKTAVMLAPSQALMLLSSAAVCPSAAGPHHPVLRLESQSKMTVHPFMDTLLLDAITPKTTGGQLVSNGSIFTKPNQRAAPVTAGQLCNSSLACCLVQTRSDKQDAADHNKHLQHAAPGSARASSLYNDLHSWSCFFILGISVFALASILPALHLWWASEKSSTFVGAAIAPASPEPMSLKLVKAGAQAGRVLKRTSSSLITSRWTSDVPALPSLPSLPSMESLVGADSILARLVPALLQAAVEASTPVLPLDPQPGSNVEPAAFEDDNPPAFQPGPPFAAQAGPQVVDGQADQGGPTAGLQGGLVLPPHTPERARLPDHQPVAPSSPGGVLAVGSSSLANEDHGAPVPAAAADDDDDAAALVPADEEDAAPTEDTSPIQPGSERAAPLQPVPAQTPAQPAASLQHFPRQSSPPPPMQAPAEPDTPAPVQQPSGASPSGLPADAPAQPLAPVQQPTGNVQQPARNVQHSVHDALQPAQDVQQPAHEQATPRQADLALPASSEMLISLPAKLLLEDSTENVERRPSMAEQLDCASGPGPIAPHPAPSAVNAPPHHEQANAGSSQSPTPKGNVVEGCGNAVVPSGCWGWALCCLKAPAATKAGFTKTNNGKIPKPVINMQAGAGVHGPRGQAP